MSKSILCGVKYLSSNRVSRFGILECEDGGGLRTISEWRYRDRAAGISFDHSQQSYSSLRQAAHVGLSCRCVVVGDDLSCAQKLGKT